MAKELTNLYQVGKSEGISEGMVKVAKKLLKKNMDIDDIVEVTELSREEIKRIKEQAQH
ncbi:putative transposase/invertase (TIGR01784 family) [Orenia metallireducens]|uniref:Transposase n=2 Tax=Orenia TaxID=46468 RepID=A0A285ICY6_9FIRM|nr:MULTISPECIES: hypothetical protein [Orenia]PRX20164.1 putative transposase/invertase (TIGR01784 family) [Orenia metallireducens]TDX48822.1 putative transposase/invertase (TIGR01784 family) [Orenia marismortui]SNY45830.1 conserved hypothetical protein (putative transposase or invertase) [Orenia metallireducens]